MRFCERPVVLSGILFAAFLLARESRGGADEGPDNLHNAPLPLAEQNCAYRWLDIAQEAAARDIQRVGARPTIVSRNHAIWATCAYDAWAAYDAMAVGSRLGGRLRRPEIERNLSNKNEAVSYASFRALVELYPDDAEYLAEEMKQLGYDPTDDSYDLRTPQGVGNEAARAVIEYRRHDGANQLGDEAGSNGEPYSDYTGYQPVNTADRCIDPDHWQPITFTRTDGSKITPGFLTPHWRLVKPFAIEEASQFRPPPPPSLATDRNELKRQVDQVLAYNSNLTAEQKGIVEFMRDGPRSTGQSGHWLRFAQDVSKRDRNTLDQDVKLYFLIANTAFDAFISSWDAKRRYDTPRPWTLVRYFYANQKLIGWAGPGGGVKELPSEEWRPYSPESFITPPFPGYTSGHATVSGACSKMLELFTGSDHFGFQAKRRCCELTEKSAGPELSLDLPTFSATAELAALSRALGGYHLPIDNEVGLKEGRELAVWSWPRYQAYFNGTATVRN